MAGEKYEDIIGLPRPVSERHARMSMGDRGAQFAPFAALTGFGSVIQESARLTEGERFLEEDSEELLNRRLRYVADHLEQAGAVTFTCYVRDPRKPGGSYRTVTGTVKRIDLHHRKLWLTTGQTVDLDALYAVEGEWEDG